MPSNHERLITELRAEFKDTDPAILLLENPPALFSAPSIVITPGDPFLENDTQGLIREHWEVLVVVALTEKSLGIGQMKDLSLRVRRAVSRAGAVWRRASGPRRTQSEEAKALVLSSNELDFKITPT